MNIVHDAFLLGLVGLLAGCVTPTDMGYVLPPEPAYTAPVYNTSPAYYATPVSGYSTMIVYDGYHPGYGGPRYPYHRPPPPPRGHHPGMHGGHHGGGRQVPVRQYQPPARRQPTIKTPPGKGVPGRGVPGRGVPPGKGGGRRK